MSRQELADACNAELARMYAERGGGRQWAGLTEKTIGALERGEIRWPNDEYRWALRTVLHADEPSLGLYIDRPDRTESGKALNRVEAGVPSWRSDAEVPGPRRAGQTLDASVTPKECRARMWGGLLNPASGDLLPVHTLEAANRGDLAEDGAEVIDVLARLHRLNRSVDPAIINLLHAETHHCLAEYETADHAQLTAKLVQQRAWIETLLDECRDPRQLQLLSATAAMTSGLLGYLAVGKARFALARAYCQEAFRLAELAQDTNLQAWTRATQSFCAYYSGDYRAALEFAHAGRAIAGTGPQSVRLAVNGVARAAGKLQDVDTVHRAVDEGYDLMTYHEAPVGLPSSIYLGCYSPAQIASNAATAYVALGMPDEVQQYAALAMPDINTSASPWSRSLVMIDIATSLLRSREGSLDHASDLVLEALSLSHSRPIVSVHQRAMEFLATATACWGINSHTKPIREALATMGSR